MTTKTCNNCGWVCAIADPLKKCPVCGTRFEQGICSVCGQPVTFYGKGRRVCKHCYDTVTRKPDSYSKVWERRDAIYAEWKSNIAKVPKSYPPLSEEQWLEAVRHFNGCAYCGSEDISTRGYFVPFKEGGRYCDWNIIPLCEKCATAIKYKPNPFKFNRPKRLMEVVDYLEERLNAALNKSTEKFE